MEEHKPDIWGPHTPSLSFFTLSIPSSPLPSLSHQTKPNQIPFTIISSFIFSTKRTKQTKRLSFSHLHILPHNIPFTTFFFLSSSSKISEFLMQGVSVPPGVAGSCSSIMSTVSKDENVVFSSEDSSCPDESELELGLGLSLSQPSSSKSHHHQKQQQHHHGLYARILTAKDFPSSAASSSSPSSSSSSSPSSLSRAKNNTTAGTKRSADSVAANYGPSQVVGWPPLRTYRMNSFNSHSKSPATEVFNSMPEKSNNNNNVLRKSADNGNDNNNTDIKEKRNLRCSVMVKVNMDGIAIGRKVDLSAHSSYETLAQTLEDMFKESTTVVTCKGSIGEDHGIIVGGERHLKLLDGSSSFVLTYEDKDGDWMLVGDVPWGMFLSSVRRLRIMRTSEAYGNGLAPRLEEKNCRQKSKPI